MCFLDSESQRLKDVDDLFRRKRASQLAFCPVNIQLDLWRLELARVNVNWLCGLRSRRKLFQQLNSASERANSIFRVLALFKAHGSIRPQLEPCGRLAHLRGRE